MAEEAKEAAAPAAAPAEGGGGGNKLVMILTLVNLVVCIGIGAVLFIAHQKENSAARVADIQPTEDGAHGEGAKEGAHGEKKAEGQAGPDGKKAEKSSVESRSVSLEQFTVNLATPGGTAQKFVRVNIALEVPTSDVEKEVQSKMPQVRNAIIDLFNSKRPNDLVSAEQREYLKEEIRNALNSFMTNGKVKGVYFTNFAVTG